MHNYYKLDVLPIILGRFKVEEIVIKGILDENTFNQIVKYCGINNSHYSDLKNDFTLDNLLDKNEYGAIFLNDDPNWYAVFNELNLIKQSNDTFPLVFICNNIFPNKRRDAYKNPNNIPEEFRNNYSDNFTYDSILINDGFYHAIEENHSKNGVLTAIEDFLEYNESIGILDLKFLNGITILYPKNSISQIRINLLLDEIKGQELEFENFIDSIFENKLLKDFISNLNIPDNDINLVEDIKLKLNEKEEIIKRYEDKIQLHNNELRYKDSQMNAVSSKLSLKDAQLKNMESKLLNHENQIKNISIECDSLKKSLSQKELIESNLNEELIRVNNKINAKDDEINFKNIKINVRENELTHNELILNSIKKQYLKKISQLDNKEYCISCYKEEIQNKRLEIQYLNKNTFTKKIFKPISYLYLIIRSHPKELSLNLKLYNALKDSKCFDIGYYLNKNEDVRNGKWCKYFSPELHYVCNGFNEKREFNKKYFNRNSKKELLDYILKCT